MSPPLEQRLAGVFGDDFADGVAQSYDFVPVGLRGACAAGAIYGVFVGLDQRAEFHFDAAEFGKQSFVAQDFAGAADRYWANRASG